MPLDPKKLKVIEALLGGKPRAEAAKAAGVSESTLLRWHKDAEFAAALSQGQGCAIKRAADVLKREAAAAAERLVKIATNPKTKTPSAICALREVLAQCRAFHEVVETAEQLRQLRAEVEALKNPPPVETPK